MRGDSLSCNPGAIGYNPKKGASWLNNDVWPGASFSQSIILCPRFFNGHPVFSIDGVASLRPYEISDFLIDLLAGIAVIEESMAIDSL
jgi:hypothetical protein